MEIILFLKCAILGIIQGITEFIPVSSTGHMVVIGKFLELKGDFVTTFNVFIQLGATCALIWYFRKDLWRRSIGVFQHSKDRRFSWYLFAAFLPVAIVGLLFHNRIELLLDSALAVGVAQILGGGLILFAEKKATNIPNKTSHIDSISFKQALSIGLWQILSLWPGMSRSGSTIMGGLLSKLNRETATKFSFYLSIPISFASSFFMIAKHRQTFFDAQNLSYLLVGFLTAFIVGLIVVRFIMNYVRSHSFIPFAYYRFALGILIIILVYRNIL